MEKTCRGLLRTLRSWKTPLQKEERGLQRNQLGRGRKASRAKERSENEPHGELNKIIGRGRKGSQLRDIDEMDERRSRGVRRRTWAEHESTKRKVKAISVPFRSNLFTL